MANEPTPLQIVSCRLRAGREWTVEKSSSVTQLKSLKREYMVVLNRPLHDNEEMDGVDVPGLPRIGSRHALHGELYVSEISFREGDGANKATLVATVEYKAADAKTSDTEGGGEEPVVTTEGAVTEWGWDDATGTRELVTDVTGKAVLNSAGDPFQSVPSVTTYTPTFTKVIKTVARQSGALEYNCKVNSTPLTIGGLECGARTLLCSVSERRLFGDPDYNYQYTIRLRYQSNKTKVGDTSTATPAEEIGWDVAITDAGMREKDLDDPTKLVNIQKPDSETGQLVTVTSPELLNGLGYTLSPTQGRSPHVLKFQAYEEVPFPAWFYSEPSRPWEEEEEE